MDGTEIYSKLATGEFPEWKDIKNSISKLAPA